MGSLAIYRCYVGPLATRISAQPLGFRWVGGLSTELAYDGSNEQDTAWRRVEALRLADNLSNHWNSLSKVSHVARVHGFTRKGNELCLVRTWYPHSLASKLHSQSKQAGTSLPYRQLVRVRARP